VTPPIRYSPARRIWYSPHPAEWRHESADGKRVYVVTHYSDGWWRLEPDRDLRATRLCDFMAHVDDVESRLIHSLADEEEAS
jgi:hypothetical protein